MYHLDRYYDKCLEFIVIVFYVVSFNARATEGKIIIIIILLQSRPLSVFSQARVSLRKVI